MKQLWVLLLLGGLKASILSNSKRGFPLTTIPPPLVCKDGRGPLLEGEDRVFPCIEECPDGFICEKFGPIAHGICCPDLEILYELYGSSEEEETTEFPTEQHKHNFEKIENLKMKSTSTFSRPATTTTRPTTTAAIVTTVKQTITTTKKTYPTTTLRVITTKAFKAKEIGTTATVATMKIFQPTKIVEEHPDKIILSSIKLKNIRRAEEKKIPNKVPTLVNFEKPQDLKSILTKVSKSSKPLNSETEHYESNLAAMKPLVDIGYTCRREKFESTCKNGTIDTQIVLRWFVKDDMCCAYAFGFCPGETVMADRTIRSKDECEQLCLGGKEFQDEAVEKVMEKLHTHNNEIQSKNEKIFLTNRLIPIPVEFDEKSGANKSKSEIFPKNVEENGFAVDENVMKNVAALINGGNFAFSVDDEKKSKPKKSCVREQFRAMCSDGMPSQFTIRWFVKDGMCCAYPYGYCHGDSIYEEEVIRTKVECEEYCLKYTEESLKNLRI